MPDRPLKLTQLLNQQTRLIDNRFGILQENGRPEVGISRRNSRCVAETGGREVRLPLRQERSEGRSQSLDSHAIMFIE